MAQNLNESKQLNEIKTESDYYLALELLESIFDSSYGSDEGKEAFRLAALIDDWELKMYPIHL